MSKKQEQEALTSLEKLEELTQDILKNSTNGGDASFRQIVFTGLTQSKNPILLEKMQELLFDKNEQDLKKTIILGIFNHKEHFAPVIEYGEKEINALYLDESYDDKESYLFVLDALIELAYKNKITEFETAIPLLTNIFKLACSENSTSVLADKLLQSFLNSHLGTVKELQKEFVEIIKDPNNEINTVVIAIDILSRAQYENLFEILDEILTKLIEQQEILPVLLPLLDIVTLSLSYFPDKKFQAKVKKILKKIQEINLSGIIGEDEILERITRRINKLQNEFNSNN